MGVYMVTVWYPPNKTSDIAKLYLKQPREIPFVTKWRAFNTAAGLEGLKQYHLIYTERGKAEEAMGSLVKYFAPFLNLKGFRYQVELLLGISDSYAALGLKWE